MPTDDRPRNEAEAIAWLVAEVPELRPVLDAHLMDMDDELLPYVVFEGGFLPWFVRAVRAGDDAPARRFVEAIELLMTTRVEPPANDGVWNLTAVCFVEGLVMQGDNDVIKRARPWLGPNVWADMQQQIAYRDGVGPPPQRS